MVNPEKEAKVSEITEKLKKTPSVILVDFRGIGVIDLNHLRKQLREKNAEIKIVKNRLTKIALKNAGCDGLDEFLAGPTALTFGYDCPVGAAKVLTEFAKKNERLKIKAGLLDKKYISQEVILQIAKTPPKEELIARLLGSLNSPAAKLCQVLKSSVSGIAYALKAVAEAKS